MLLKEYPLMTTVFGTFVMLIAALLYPWSQHQCTAYCRGLLQQDFVLQLNNTGYESC